MWKLFSELFVALIKAIIKVTSFMPLPVHGTVKAVTTDSDFWVMQKMRIHFSGIHNILVSKFQNH